MNPNPSKEPATLGDVEKGDAIFHVPDNRSQFYDLGHSLPVRARAIKEISISEAEKIPVGTLLEIVQAEIVDGRDVLLGFLLNGTGDMRAGRDRTTIDVVPPYQSGLAHPFVMSPEMGMPHPCRSVFER